MKHIADDLYESQGPLCLRSAGGWASDPVLLRGYTPLDVGTIDERDSRGQGPASAATRDSKASAMRASAAARQQDLELVRRVAAGEPAAKQVFAERLAIVCAFVRKRMAAGGRSVQAAAVEDVVQNTFVALLGKLDTFNGASRIETWACGFAFFELRKWTERSAQEQSRRTQDMIEPDVEDSPPDDVHPQIEQAVESLGRPTSEIIRLRHFEELAFPEISRRLDLPEATAKSCYYRGLIRLRNALGSLKRNLAP